MDNYFFALPNYCFEINERYDVSFTNWITENQSKSTPLSFFFIFFFCINLLPLIKFSSFAFNIVS